MTKAWRTLAALGFISALAASGCVVGSGDDDTGGTGGTTGGSGGTTGGTGGSTGGTAGATGGTAGSTGGTAGSTGGSAGYVCDNNATGTPTPGSCEPDDPSNACQTCVKASCCTEYEACVGTNPNNPCGYGAPDGSGEIFCIINKITVEGQAYADAAAACATPECVTISDATNTLFTCLDANCLAQCLQ